MMTHFLGYVGVDYSGAGDPKKPARAIRVFSAEPGVPPSAVSAPRGERLWTRERLAEWLLETLSSGSRTIVGLDHAFSFPISYFRSRGLTTWDAFLADFAKRFQTDEYLVRKYHRALKRLGRVDELRRTEEWTGAAKSVFQLEGRGSVAYSTFAGLPWIKRLRVVTRDRVHFWPFDGFDVPAERSIVAEVYPALFWRRYRKELAGAGESSDERDARAVCRWLQQRDEAGLLSRHLNPPLSSNEREVALLEGWILGVS